MSLIYLITSLPVVEPGQPPPLGMDEFAATARSHLEGADRHELEQVLLVSEIDKTILARNRKMLGLPIDSQDTPFEEYQRQRALAADREERLLPAWALKDRPMHLLLRYWFQKVYKHARSHFLKRYSALWLNTEEMLAGLLCKLEGMDPQKFLTQMEGGIDSTWKVIMAHYGDHDLGIAGRLRNYPEVREVLQMTDLAQMEQRLDVLRRRLIDRCLGTETFSIGQVLAYYFRLRLVHREAARDAEKGRAMLDDILQFSPETTP
ncbi:MAG: DUF2764 family protein [Acidobacteriota bacterium]|nr:DUF2764 family protein [Acidobacteriota bacterium]